MAAIIIRDLKTPAEMDAAVELQKVYWGEDMGALVPAHMLLSLAGHGGHIPAAFDGAHMVGMLIGFLGADLSQPDDTRPLARRLLVMSKRMVVLPAYRSHNIGTMLKLAQRAFALRWGVQLVTWTFDPLLARNAYLNLHKLGAVGQRYAVNYFGEDSDYALLNADRLVVNWWVEHPRTQAHLGGELPSRSISTWLAAGAQALNTVHYLPNQWPQPIERIAEPEAGVILVEIPADFLALQAADAPLAQAWRDHVRVVFQRLVAAGYLATDFTREDARTCYLFTRDDQTYRFRDALPAR